MALAGGSSGSESGAEQTLVLPPEGSQETVRRVTLANPATKRKLVGQEYAEHHDAGCDKSAWPSPHEVP